VGDYLVLESLSQEKNNSRFIYIIRPSVQKDVFKLGRGHESDLRINDISVSRCHAKIKLENGKFLLEDNQSKFGTLVLVKQRTPLLPNYNKAVQVGRTVINFSVKPQSNSTQAQHYNVHKLKSKIPNFTSLNELDNRNPLIKALEAQNNDQQDETDQIDPIPML
jgi:pSer/pThr/pTyr-binding forkhead associated (FHA) protein